jgi:hypothetical protein
LKKTKKTPGKKAKTTVKTDNAAKPVIQKPSAAYLKALKAVAAMDKHGKA